MPINKAAVIGAGVMGAGIAAHLANAGLEVELLDRSDIAAGAIEKLLKSNPAALMHKRNAKKIRPGNVDADLERLKDCDLIIEAVLEDPAVKTALFLKIDAHRKAGSTVASNTSTIPLADLVAGQSDAFKKDFVITHFFNPPRYMPLLELVVSKDNDPARVEEIRTFMDVRLGKGVIRCFDRPGFIGNRIGTFWLQTAVNEAIARGLTVEEADAVMSRPIGVPKTGAFGLIDLVGLDLMPHISKSLLSKLPADDAYVRTYKSYPVIEKMIATGYTGRKGKGGFYRLNEKKEKLAIDLNTGAERPSKRVKFKPKDLRALVDDKSKLGAYGWSVLKQVLCYAATHAHDITENITGVDEAMKLGYGWKYGPFELLDKIGVDHFIAKLKADREPVPALIAHGKKFYRVTEGKLQFLNKDGSYADVKRAPGVLLLSDVKRASKPVYKNFSASLWDIGDGVLCAEFHSKMNALDFFSMRALNKACDIVEGGTFKALVIHNEAPDFSVGANIGVAMVAAKLKQYWIIDKMVTMGQSTYKRLKYASFPVVSAPAGKALGGGCEVLLHSSHVQAHAELYPGLVEVGVGLLPAWGGSTELLTRAAQNKKLPRGPMPGVSSVFEMISTAKVALSAEEAKDMMYLRATDGITMNKSRLLFDAKTKALEMLKNFKPEAPCEIELPGPSGRASLNLAVDGFYLRGLATNYDVVVSDRVARVLTGGDKAGPGWKVSQDYLRALERFYFMQLARDGRTLKRIESIIKAGKPLREKPVAGEKSTDLRRGLKGDNINDNKGLVKDERPKFFWPKV